MLLGVLFFGTDCSSQEQPAKAEAQETESKFLRYRQLDPNNAALETAVTTYQDVDGRRVDLVAAVHIGDSAYFELLNRLFPMYDAVLYELVAEQGSIPEPGGGDSGVSTVQRAMKDILALDFQLDVIDYTRKNFVHADLDPKTFFRMQKEVGESLFTLILQSMLQEWQNDQFDPQQALSAQLGMILALLSSDRAFSMKCMLAQQFDQLEKLAAGLEKGVDGKGSVLLVGRNKAALEVLERELAAGKTRLAIFYGAAHLPDFERRLIDEFSFQKSRENWITAWKMAKKKAQKPATEPADG
jgi:hypothetical protein